jgi:hypothetical protein
MPHDLLLRYGKGRREQGREEIENLGRMRGEEERWGERGREREREMWREGEGIWREGPYDHPDSSSSWKSAAASPASSTSSP